MSRDDRSDDELLPEDCKALYESLIGDGAELLDATSLDDAAVQRLVHHGLACIGPGNVPQVAPVMPRAAFERALLRWHDRADRIRTKSAAIYRDAIVLQHRLVRLADAQTRSFVDVVVEPTQVTALHTSSTRTAQKVLSNWITGPYGDPAIRTNASQPIDNYFASAPDLLARGGTDRCLYDAAVLSETPQFLEAGYADGEEIRLRDEKLPMKLLIVDDHSALVPLRPYGSPALFIRSRPLVALFQRFFDLVWETATPWTPDGATRQQNTRSDQRVLELMAEGLKDEAIARKCGVSVRTVRRQIATIMDELGARTRFAAGVAAVRLGRIGSA